MQSIVEDLKATSMKKNKITTVSSYSGHCEIYLHGRFDTRRS